MSDEEKKDESNNYDIISSVKITRKKAYNKYITELWKDSSLQSPDILKGISKKVFYSYFIFDLSCSVYIIS